MVGGGLYNLKQRLGNSNVDVSGDFFNNPDNAVSISAGFSQGQAVVLGLPTHSATPSFTPLPNSGTPNNSYIIKPEDNLWKIGKSLGLSDGETMRFITDTEASARAAGSNANVNDLKPGNTLALPDWVQDKLRQADTAGTDGSDAHFNHHPATDSAPTGDDTTDAATQQIIDAFRQPAVISNANDVQLADASGATGTGTVSDAGTGGIGLGNTSTPNALGQNQPPALADTTGVAINTVAPGPDGSDAHFNNHPDITGATPPPAPPRAIFQTPETDAALQPLANGIGVINSITALAHWDTQSDLGRLSSLVNLYTSFDKLSGDKLPGDLGQFGGYLSLGISLQNGDGLGVVSSINTIGNGVVDNAINSALGSSGVPYVSTLMALNNFEAHPGQSLGSIIGSFWGPAGSVMGSAIGGMLDSIFGGGSPPPPEGIVHYALDENGAVQVQVETNTSGGAAPASQVAGQLLGVLQGVVDQQNAADANANPGDNLSIDPSRLPRVGFDHEHTWIELTRPDGSIVREAIDPSTIGQRMLQVALDNDALVPQWQIQTTLAHTQAQAPVSQPSAQAPGSDADPATPHTTPSAAPSTAPVHATQGHALEAADHKTQTYDTLVVHLSPERSAQVQANIEAITATRLKADTEGMKVEQLMVQVGAVGHATRRQTCKRNGLRSHLSKVLRVKTVCSPRRTYGYSYECSSNQKNDSAESGTPYSGVRTFCRMKTVWTGAVGSTTLANFL